MIYKLDLVSLHINRSTNNIPVMQASFSMMILENATYSIAYKKHIYIFLLLKSIYFISKNLLNRYLIINYYHIYVVISSISHFNTLYKFYIENLELNIYYKH